MAALECLEEYGFAGTSTLRIQKRAGMSRGRLLHQFASKNELVVAAVHRLAETRFEELGTLTANYSSERPLRAIDLLWQTHQGGLFWVATELWLAARLDDELRTHLLREEREIGRLIRMQCDALFGPDVVAHPSYASFRELLISSMRGVALTYSFDKREMTTEPMLAVWRKMASEMLDLDET